MLRDDRFVEEHHSINDSVLVDLPLWCHWEQRTGGKVTRN